MYCISKFHYSFLSGLSMHSSVGSIYNLRIGGRWFVSLAPLIFYPRTDDSHCDRIPASLTTVHCFDSRYVGNQLGKAIVWSTGYGR